MQYQVMQGDCLALLPGLETGSVDAVITDPPYGLGDKWQGGTWFQRGVYNGSVLWDGALAVDAVQRLVSMGLPCVIWGGNNYALPPSRCWLMWDKPNAVPTMASFEMAWTNLDIPSKAYRRPCNGWARQHPTEKPLDLMRWCIRLATKPGDTVLDPFMGSGTTGVACMMEGRNFIGIEIDSGYYEIARKRIAEAAAQPRLIPEAAPITHTMPELFAMAAD